MVFGAFIDLPQVGAPFRCEFRENGVGMFSGCLQSPRRFLFPLAGGLEPLLEIFHAAAFYDFWQKITRTNAGCGSKEFPTNAGAESVPAGV